MNRVMLIGRLTAKPELRYTNSNIAVTSFSIAVKRPRQKDKEDEVDFIDCVSWRGQAETIAKYQDKGNLIAVEGSLRKESYQDREGNTRYNTSVLVNRVEFLSNKSNHENQLESAQEQTDPFVDFGEQVSIEDNYLD